MLIHQQKETRYKVQHKTQQQEADNLAKKSQSTTQGPGYLLFTVHLPELHTSDVSVENRLLHFLYFCPLC